MSTFFAEKVKDVELVHYPSNTWKAHLTEWQLSFLEAHRQKAKLADFGVGSWVRERKHLRVFPLIWGGGLCRARKQKDVANCGWFHGGCRVIILGEMWRGHLQQWLG